MIVEYRHRPRLRQNKKTLLGETQAAVKALLITLSTMIAALAIIFLAITGQNAQKGYALDQAKLRNEELKTINTNLTTQITNSTSFTNLEENDKTDAMQEPEVRNYVTDEDNRVK